MIYPKWFLRSRRGKLRRLWRDALPSDTIFAFLTLNTMSPAHNKIFGAKFLSFERATIVC